METPVNTIDLLPVLGHLSFCIVCFILCKLRLSTASVYQILWLTTWCFLNCLKLHPRDVATNASVFALDPSLSVFLTVGLPFMYNVCKRERFKKVFNGDKCSCCNRTYILQQYFLTFSILFHCYSRCICFSCAVQKHQSLSFISPFWKNYSLYFRPMDVYIENCLKPSEPQCFNLFSVKKKKKKCAIFSIITKATYCTENHSCQRH